jgi:hypothetical protein
MSDAQASCDPELVLTIKKWHWTLIFDKNEVIEV